jgi:hypothetical protein
MSDYYLQKMYCQILAEGYSTGSFGKPDKNLLNEISSKKLRINELWLEDDRRVTAIFDNFLENGKTATKHIDRLLLRSTKRENRNYPCFNKIFEKVDELTEQLSTYVGDDGRKLFATSQFYEILSQGDSTIQCLHADFASGSFKTIKLLLFCNIT